MRSEPLGILEEKSPGNTRNDAKLKEESTGPTRLWDCLNRTEFRDGNEWGEIRRGSFGF